MLFSEYGIEIIKDRGKFFVRYDSGESASHMIEKEITEEEAIRAQRSSQDAYAMLIERERRGS